MHHMHHIVTCRGFSIRDVDLVRQCVALCAKPHMDATLRGTLCASAGADSEDVFFGNCIPALGGRVPTSHQAASFSVESIPFPSPIGMHIQASTDPKTCLGVFSGPALIKAGYAATSEGVIRTACAACPELATIPPLGCEAKYAELCPSKPSKSAAGGMW